ncbi:MAG TPA: amino acid ABC transporter substrate-binding protein [Roseiarcus sp.]|jgi:general L-amino acid transport system substrate-binding protein|nr:amino acid ABC transporter substrate-binding protein [Roseiarcus sp.]
MRSSPRVFAPALFAVAAGATSALAGTLDEVRQRDAVICGVSQGVPGFSIADASGAWSGFDVDFCRAVAAATLGDASKVRFVPLAADERFEALKAKKIDLLSRNSTWTMGRETELGLVFAGVNYYDGQGFLVPKAKHVESAFELDGSKVCVQSGTTSELNVADFFQANHMKMDLVVTPTIDALQQAYQSGRCDVMTNDVSGLYAIRTKLPKPDDHVILADVISKEPLGPAVRQDDMTWFNIVKWVNFALVDAEDLGIGVKTVDDALKSQKPDVKRFVGAEGEFGRQLGLPPNWAVAAVKASGNYGEMFERNLGAKSQLGIPRGLNELWSNGGVQYAPPIR